MANALYNTFKSDLGLKVFQMETDVFKATLIDSADYTFNAAHDEYSGGALDVPNVAKVAESADIGGTWSSAGVFDSNDFAWTSVTGDQSEAIILWDDTLTNDRLVLFMDTGITGMPITPSGGNINVTVNGAGWFSV